MAESNTLDDFLAKNPEVNFIQLRWMSLSAILHTKFITTSGARDIVAGKRQYCTNQSGMVMPIATAPQCEIVRVMRCPIEPDWKSLRLCSFTPGHASVMCSIASEGEADRYLQCPRHLLEETLGVIQQKHPQASFLIGFEIEFTLLDATFEPAQSIDQVVSYCMNSGLRCNTLKIMEEICYALEKANVEVYHFHTEDPHQLEIALKEKAPMKAIDDMVFACEAIRSIAARHELKATITPKPMSDASVTNGLHMHISAYGIGNSESFLAGIMNKLRAITVFGIANYDGFERVKDGKAGQRVGWGTEHRDLPIRRIKDSHWEIRCADATANFYLFLAVILKAAMAGLHENKDLVQEDVQELSKDITKDEWILEYGVTEHLPRSLQEAIDAAISDPDVVEWIGWYMFDLYLRIKEVEIESFKSLTPEQRRHRFVKFF
jgi:glutamine synthetase